ncbi:MAG: hypothetical protein OXC09_10020 [Truepera sp.]|nr:hypothetical protein [Truepera sp.]
MIRVHKPRAPKGLARGKALTREDCEAYEANRVDFENGTRKFQFKRNIYGHCTVRGVLKSAQNGKCCYCEGKAFAPHAAADVEHYRPKGTVRQDEQSGAVLPGYFWLAYSWENLYLCCQICNRNCKRDIFPLKNPAKRARSHADNLAEEEPLILDPGGLDDPRKHIRFHKEIAFGLTEVGRNTIQIIGLNRPELGEARLTRRAKLERQLEIVKISQENPHPQLAKLAEEASNTLKAAVLREAEFSAMAIDLLEVEPSS